VNDAAIAARLVGSEAEQRLEHDDSVFALGRDRHGCRQTDDPPAHYHDIRVTIHTALRC
jgi:hypothetical protein